MHHSVTNPSPGLSSETFRLAPPPTPGSQFLDPGTLKRILLILLSLGWLVPGTASTLNPFSSNFTYKAEIALREAFDSNVYLQDLKPDLDLVPKAAPSRQGSWVTSVVPHLGFTLTPNPMVHLAAGYEPEVVFYHSESSEDHVTHRGMLRLGGTIRDAAWELPNHVTWIDGSDLGLFFGGPGGAPAIGGIPIRDRRAAFLYRGGFEITLKFGEWFFRPIGSVFLHHFFTKQLDTRLPENRGYLNYVDRSDFNGGFDAGYRVLPHTDFVFGYRNGYQDEGRLIGVPFEYDNTYQRLLVGLEGKPVSWMELVISLGPDFRRFGPNINPRSEADHVVLYVDSFVSLKPTDRDAITLKIRQFEQPAFASCSVYRDTSYDLSWRHGLGPGLGSTMGFRAYQADWMEPVARDDWIFTPSASFTFAISPHGKGEIGYSYDWSQSRVAMTDGREFTRHLIWFGCKYSL